MVDSYFLQLHGRFKYEKMLNSFAWLKRVADAWMSLSVFVFFGF